MTRITQDDLERNVNVIRNRLLRDLPGGWRVELEKWSPGDGTRYRLILVSPDSVEYHPFGSVYWLGASEACRAMNAFIAGMEAGDRVADAVRRNRTLRRV